MNGRSMVLFRFVTFGETMVQYNARYSGQYKENGEYLKDCAGTEFNVAVNLRKLACPDVETTWVSRLGDDDAGSFILKNLVGKPRVFAQKYAREYTGISYLNYPCNDKHIKTYCRKDSTASRSTFEDVRPAKRRFSKHFAMHVR